MNDLGFLLAPGAGAPSTHKRMQDFRALLERFGVVQAFDYAYAREGRKSPDRLPKLIETHRAALNDFRAHAPGKIFLAGKSMGGRVGCHLALQEPVAGLICFGYPLCGAGDATKLRDEVLRQLETPVLFIQGTKDRLCPLDLLDDVRKRMKAPSRLHVVEGGDHSLLVGKTELKARGLTQGDVDAAIGAAIGAFVAGP